MKNKICICVFIILLMCGCSNNKRIYKKLIKNEYKILYQFDSFGSYHDLEMKCYDTYLEKEKCKREIMDENSEPFVYLVGNENDGLMSDRNYFAYTPSAIKFNKFSYHYHDGKNGEFVYLWSKDLSQKYIIVNLFGYDSCNYVIRGEIDNEYENCAGEALNEAATFYEYVKIKMNKLSITESDLVTFFDYLNDQYIEEQVESLYEMNKEISYDEFLNNVEKKYYEIYSYLDTVFLSCRESPYIDNNYLIDGDISVSFKDNEVDFIIYDGKENGKVIYDASKKNNYVMFDNSKCLYNYDYPLLSYDCSEEEKEKANLLGYFFETKLTSFRVTQDEFVLLITMYYTNN